MTENIRNVIPGKTECFSALLKGKKFLIHEIGYVFFIGLPHMRIGADVAVQPAGNNRFR